MSGVYDVAVLGGGPAGYVAAIRAAQLGATVAIVEKSALGGVCMNVGCIPTKALVTSAEVFSTVKGAKEYGVNVESPSTTWETAISRKDRIVKILGKGVAHLMSANGITVYHGEGSVISANDLSVKPTDGGEEIVVSSKKLILATGSEPHIPKFINGCEHEGVITSTGALSLATLPKKMVVIGGGVIGIEFAVMYTHAGVDVTVLELSEQILPYEDAEIAAELQKLLKRQGVNFELTAKVTDIEKSESGLSVKYEKDGVCTMLDCENVLLAVGRTLNSNIADSLGVDTEKGRISVNEYMETSVPNVYACGDVIGGRLLAHLSFMEGRCAAENAMGKKSTINYNAVPACVYSSPEVASVGMMEKEAREKGIEPKIGRFDFRVNGRALTLGERDGFVKIVADDRGVIIGGQILGVNASEMISELTLAVALGVTANTLADIIHPHPALNEAIWEACNAIANKPIHG